MRFFPSAERVGKSLGSSAKRESECAERGRLRWGVGSGSRSRSQSRSRSGSRSRSSVAGRGRPGEEGDLHACGVRRARGRAVGGGGTLFGFLILRLVAAWSDAAERELHGGGAQPRNIDPALRKSSMSAVLAIVDQGQEQVNGAGASGPHP